MAAEAERGVSDIDAIDAAEFRRISAIILDGAFICVKAALAALRASGQGAIVNIGGMSNKPIRWPRQPRLAPMSACDTRPPVAFSLENTDASASSAMPRTS